MSRQPLFMYYRAREQERQHETRTAFNLKFNDEHYAIPTPEFWSAWRAKKKVAGNQTIHHQYAPGKYPADQLSSLDTVSVQTSSDVKTSLNV